jgi:tRNA (adenine37-N6)-methyltransferase
MAIPSYTFTPIGTVKTEFRKKYDAPRQPLEDVEQASKRVVAQDGVITLFPHLNYEQALADLAGFDRVWLLYVFHENFYENFYENLRGETAHWKPKVLPPRGRVKRGVFATRAPYRPNPIGISVVNLKQIRGLQVFIGNCDLLDGTPILDLKPYLPEYDSFPASKAGWWDEERAAEQSFTIEISAKAAEQLAFLAEHNVHLLEAVRHILERDPFPHPYHRIVSIDEPSNGSEYYELAHKDWRLRYSIRTYCICIDEVRSGYTADTLPPNMPVHQAFLTLSQSFPTPNTA